MLLGCVYQSTSLLAPKQAFHTTTVMRPEELTVGVGGRFRLVGPLRDVDEVMFSLVSVLQFLYQQLVSNGG